MKRTLMGMWYVFASLAIMAIVAGLIFGLIVALAN